MKKQAFDEADVRVLSTLASSMGVALENARLFDETKRLLTETNERAAELALINDVQRGLAEKLDIQAMYDLVGDKIQEIFDAQVVDIGIYDPDANLTHFPYTIERGVRFPDEPNDRRLRRVRPGRSRADPVVRGCARLADRPRKRPTVIQGEDAKGPVRSDDRRTEVRGRISLQNIDREGAFTDSDLRLLTLSPPA